MHWREGTGCGRLRLCAGPGLPGACGLRSRRALRDFLRPCACRLTVACPRCGAALERWRVGRLRAACRRCEACALSRLGQFRLDHAALRSFVKRQRISTETITLLARMARFIVADITDARSVLQELRAIVPDLPSVPVQPIILATQEEPGMFDFFHNFRSFLKVHHYSNQQHLIADLGERVIGPAEKWRSVREGAAGQTG